MIIILMGVAGAGKTTAGTALARRLGWRFADADNFHSAAAIAKMRAGIPLTDADREPWLESLHEAILQWLHQGDNVVLACSALRAEYRKRLAVSPEVKLVFLRVGGEVAAARLSQRGDSFFNPRLLSSQFETLEEPRDAVIVDASLNVDEIVETIRAALNL
jgi:gluconokinase